MERIESLVGIVYDPGSSRELIQQAQRELQTEQNSANGWQLAHLLLASPNPQTQFLGAQTFIVKLNRGSNLPSTAQQRQDLLLWLVRTRDENYAPFVVRKLFGAITKLYYANDSWPSCPFEVVNILGAGSPLCLEFLNFLIEDSQLSASDLRNKLVPDVTNVVSGILMESKMLNESAMKTFEIWSLAFFDQFKELVSTLVALAIELLSRTRANETDDFETAEIESTALSVLGNLYTTNWRSWPPLARRHLTEALVNTTRTYTDFVGLMEDEVFLGVARLVLAICQEDFSDNVALHPFLVQLAGLPIPVVEDLLSSEILDFWNQYTEEVISSGLSSTSETSAVIASVISGYWPRIKLYPELKMSDWTEFASFRKDFADFLELSYPILGTQLFDHLTDVVLSSLRSNPIDWMSIESALYCLNGLADIIGEDYRGEKPEFRNVQRIFQSELWTKLSECEHLRVRQTAVNLIGCFVDFFLSAEGEPFLAVTLNYLFTSLGSKPLQTTASRSVQKLCDICRAKLVSEIPAFLAIYDQMKTVLDGVPHVRTVGGISCVIQSVEQLEYQASALDQLISAVVTSYVGAPPENAAEAQQTIYKCVATIARNMQDPSPNPQSKSLQDNTTSSVAQFWQQNETAVRIRQKLNEIIYSGFQSSDLGTVEAVCGIIKVGITDEIGPFGLSDESITSFITQKAHTASPETISAILDLARFYAMSMAARVRQGRQLAPPASSLAALIAISRQFSDTSASAVLDLLTQLVALSSSLHAPFVQLAPGSPDTIIIAITGLESSDRFVLRSAVAFWKELLSSAPHLDEGDQARTQQTLDLEIANQLVRVLLLRVSGLAPRSDIASLSQVFKALTSDHSLIASKLLKHYVVEAPEWDAISQQDMRTRNTFVAQLFLVKSTKRMTEVIQKFWLACRGIPETYDPQTSLP